MVPHLCSPSAFWSLLVNATYSKVVQVIYKSVYMSVCTHLKCSVELCVKVSWQHIRGVLWGQLLSAVLQYCTALCSSMCALPSVSLHRMAPKSTLSYPTARRGPEVEDHFGTLVPDPYRYVQQLLFVPLKLRTISGFFTYASPDADSDTYTSYRQHSAIATFADGLKTRKARKQRPS